MLFFKPLQRQWTGLWIALFTGMCALILTACGSSMPLLPDSSQPPANLRQPCPDLQQLSDGTGGAVLKWGVGAAHQYRECQDRHRKLVEAWPR